MKMSLRTLMRRAKSLPFIGPFIAVPLALYRLPLLYSRLANIDERLAHLEARLGAPGHGTDTFPTNEDIQNLVVSAPIALRKLRRDLDLLLADSHALISKESNE